MILRILLLVVVVFNLSTAAWGEPITAYVGEFSVTGAANRDEIKSALQTLLLSRLATENITPQDQPTGANVFVTGSYISIGKVFSIDAVAKGGGGSVLTRAFVQGEGSDELIPSIGKLAKQLSEGIAKGYKPLPPKEAVVPPAVTVTPPTVPVEAPSAGKAPPAATTWASQRLAGTFVGMAMGNTSSADRDIFLASSHGLQYYRLGAELKKISEVDLGNDLNILSIDTADIDGDGQEEIYLTIFSEDNLSSQVWQLQNNSLKKLAEGLPFYFRAVQDNGNKRLYGQQMGVDQDYYGGVGEVVRIASGYQLKNSLKLPSGGNIYNFNRIVDREGKPLQVLINRDGYLLVFDGNGQELWRSNDKYGGSSVYFKRPDNSSMRRPDSPLRTTFIEQRMVVTGQNELIVPQNTGTWVVGYNRVYSKNSLVSLTWNGAALEEQKRTKESQNYLADFAYDDKKKELTLLEIAKKEGVFEKGASILLKRKFE